MKKTLLLLGMAIFFAAPVISQVVFTSGFETWTSTPPIKPTDWVGVKTSFAADSIIQYTANVHGGTYACKLQDRTTTHKRLTTQALSVTAGTSYAITFWARGHGSIRTGIYDGCSTAYGFHYNSYIAINSSTWTQQSQTIAADTTFSAAEFILSVKSTFADLDDIQVDDVSISTAVINTVSIHDIQYTTTAPYDSPYNNQIINTGGIVTGKYSKGFFMQSGSGAWNGILVFDSAVAVSLNRGDSVALTGMVTEYYNMTEIKNIVSYSVVSTGNAEPIASNVTAATVKNEQYESVLVKTDEVACVVPPNTYGEWQVSEGFTGYDTCTVDDLLFSYNPPSCNAVDISYKIKGALYYSYGNFMIEPRDSNDIEIITGINEHGYDYGNISIYPNPVSNNLSINNIEGINIINLSNILGKKIRSTKVSGDNITINVADLPKGVYIISLIDNNRNISISKFIKE